MSAPADQRLIELPHARAGEAVDVLCASFHDYPVMRYAIGDAGTDYDRRLQVLIGLFVASRVMRGHPIYAIEEAGRPVAVATTTPSGALSPPGALQPRIDAVWADLGAEARARFDKLVAVWDSIPMPEPNVHLNMLGTLPSHQGKGLGRLLLERVQDLSRETPGSKGVTLSTEDPKNVLLYEHCGYRVIGHARVDETLETWLLFRE